MNKRGKIVQENKKQKRVRNILIIALIVILCAFTVILDFVEIEYISDELQNAIFSKLIQQTCGGIAAVLLMIQLKIRLFGKPKNLLYLIPCLIIAVDNFQFSAYFNGKMELLHNEALDFIFFAGYCLAVGAFEECVFRGVIFSLLAGVFPQNKKGFLLTYVLSSVVFGLTHIMNGISWQIGYTILTGGLFAFCLIKTKNVFCAAFVHGLYNFCGLLFEYYNPELKTIGLGSGVVFDTGTVVTMIIVSVLVGVFILYKVITYSESERIDLYEKLGIKLKKEERVEGESD